MCFFLVDLVPGTSITKAMRSGGASYFIFNNLEFESAKLHVVMTKGIIAQALDSAHGSSEGELHIEVHCIRGFKLRLSMKLESGKWDVVEEWCATDLFMQTFPCLRGDAVISSVKVTLQTRDVTQLTCLCQTFAQRTLPTNRTIEALLLAGITLQSFGVAQSTADIGIKNVNLASFLPAQVPDLVRFLEVNRNLERLCVQFKDEPPRVDSFDQRTSLSHLWSGIASSQLEHLELDLILPNPDLRFDDENLAPVPFLKSLTVRIKHTDIHDEDSLVASNDRAPINASPTVPMPCNCLKLFLSCDSLERLTYFEESRFDERVPHLIRKQTFLAYCEAISTSLTVKNVVLLSRFRWWRDQECINAALLMVRSNKRLVKFDTFSAGEEYQEELKEARCQIDFWQWVNENVEEDKLVQGAISPRLWPFLIERLMREPERPEAGGEKRLSETVLKRTTCYHLLAQRIDLLAYGDRKQRERHVTIRNSRRKWLPKSIVQNEAT